MRNLQFSIVLQNVTSWNLTTMSQIVSWKKTQLTPVSSWDLSELPPVNSEQSIVCRQPRQQTRSPPELLLKPLPTICHVLWEFQLRILELSEQNTQTDIQRLCCRQNMPMAIKILKEAISRMEELFLLTERRLKSLVNTRPSSWQVLTVTV